MCVLIKSFDVLWCFF